MEVVETGASPAATASESGATGAPAGATEPSPSMNGGAPMDVDAPAADGAAGANGGAPMDVDAPADAPAAAADAPPPPPADATPPAARLEAAMASCADAVGTPTSALAPKPDKPPAADGGLADFGGDAPHVADAPLVEPDVIEMRLLQHLDSTGAVADTSAAGEKLHQLLTQARLRDAGASAKAVFLVVLRRSANCEPPRRLALRTFLNLKGLTSLGAWLEDATKAGDEALAVLCVRTLADLPVTSKIVKSSSVGKVVKRLKKEREAAFEGGGAAGTVDGDALHGACALLMQRWLAKVNQSDAVQADEEAELAALEEKRRDEAARKAQPKPKMAKKRAGSNDLLASALTKKSRGEALSKALDGSREERIQARRAGRGVAGVKEVVVDTETEAFFGGLDDDGPAATPTSRTIDADLAKKLAEKAAAPDGGRKIRWADDAGAELVAEKEPEPGWLDDYFDESDDVDASLSIEDRKKKEHEAERTAMEKAKVEAAEEARADRERRLAALRAMKPARPWKRPTLSVVPKECIPDIDYASTAGDATAQRLKRVMEARYLHPRDVPPHPDDHDLGAPDKTTRRTSATARIPAAESDAPPDESDARPPPGDFDNRHHQPPPPPKAHAAATGLPEAITRLDEDTLRYLLQNQPLYDSLFVNRVLDERRLADIVDQVRRRKR